jgi:hypothetical protein
LFPPGQLNSNRLRYRGQPGVWSDDVCCGYPSSVTGSVCCFATPTADQTRSQLLPQFALQRARVSHFALVVVYSPNWPAIASSPQLPHPQRHLFLVQHWRLPIASFAIVYLSAHRIHDVSRQQDRQSQHGRTVRLGLGNRVFASIDRLWRSRRPRIVHIPTASH